MAIKKATNLQHMNIKTRPHHIKEIGFKFFRLWTRYYLCVGYVQQGRNDKGKPTYSKDYIECYQCNESGEVLNTAAVNMDFPFRIWNEKQNFEIIKIK